MSERFWSKVDMLRAGGCWQWTGHIGTKGYGTYWRDDTNALAHRVAYELTFGGIPEDSQIDHLCGHRWCVNPAHLDPVTCKENLLRSGHTWATRNSLKTHCPQGHPYSGENLHLRPGGGRRCRACARAHAREQTKKKQLQKKEQTA